LEKVNNNQQLTTVNTFADDIKSGKPLSQLMLQNHSNFLTDEKKISVSNYPAAASKLISLIQSHPINVEDFCKQFISLLKNKDALVRSAALELFVKFLTVAFKRENIAKLAKEIFLLLEKNEPIYAELFPVIIELIAIQPDIANSKLINKIGSLALESSDVPGLQAAATKAICRLGQLWRVYQCSSLTDYIQKVLTSSVMSIPAHEESTFFKNINSFFQVKSEEKQHHMRASQVDVGSVANNFNG
jgi:hypothetical protein